MTDGATYTPSRHTGLMDSRLNIASIDSLDLAGIANIAALFIGANLDRNTPVIPGFSFAEAIREIRTIRSANAFRFSKRTYRAWWVNQSRGFYAAFPFFPG